MFPAQVGLLGIQMIWTRDSEVALKNAKVDKKVTLVVFCKDFLWRLENENWMSLKSQFSYRQLNCLYM